MMVRRYPRVDADYRAEHVLVFLQWRMSWCVPQRTAMIQYAPGVRRDVDRKARPGPPAITHGGRPDVRHAPARKRDVFFFWAVHFFSHPKRSYPKKV